jgi:flagellar biosynthesis regulator FlbT
MKYIDICLCCSQWFEEKTQQIENLDTQLRKLHTSVETLVLHRKDLALLTSAFAKSAAMLSNCEEHTSLSRALSQLAEVEEKVLISVIIDFRLSWWYTATVDPVSR